MKTGILIIAIWVLSIKPATAQVAQQEIKIDSSANVHPFSKEPKVLYIINSHNKQYELDSLYSVKNIDPNWIESISVLKDKKDADKYGKRAAQHGVVIITIKEEEYPAAFKRLKKSMKKIKTKVKLPQQM